MYSLCRETEEAVVDAEKTVAVEKQTGDEEGADASKENAVKEAEEEAEPEDKVKFCMFIVNVHL